MMSFAFNVKFLFQFIFLFCWFQSPVQSIPLPESLSLRYQISYEAFRTELDDPLNQQSENENIRLGNYLDGIQSYYSILTTGYDPAAGK